MVPVVERGLEAKLLLKPSMKDLVMKRQPFAVPLMGGGAIGGKAEEVHDKVIGGKVVTAPNDDDVASELDSKESNSDQEGEEPALFRPVTARGHLCANCRPQDHWCCCHNHRGSSG